MPSYRVIARVEKTHGRAGEVVTVPVHGLPSLMHKGLRVCVVPPRLKGDRWHVVEAADRGDYGQRIRLSEVGDLGAAKALVGRYLLADASDLPQDLALHEAEALVGRTVRDEGRGVDARIAEVLRGPANDAWTLRGDFGEVVIPVIASVVDQVPEQGPIPVRIPDGLLPQEGDAR